MKNKMKDILKKLLNASVSNEEAIYSLVKELGLLDTQEVMDWQDALNAISVRYK